MRDENQPAARESLQRTLDALHSRLISELRYTCNNPPLVITRTLHAVLVLLGCQNPTWKDARAQMADSRTFLQKLRQVDPAAVPEERVAVLQDYIADKEAVLKATKANVTTSALARWVYQVCDYVKSNAPARGSSSSKSPRRARSPGKASGVECLQRHVALIFGRPLDPCSLSVTETTVAFLETGEKAWAPAGSPREGLPLFEFDTCQQYLACDSVTLAQAASYVHNEYGVPAVGCMLQGQSAALVCHGQVAFKVAANGTDGLIPSVVYHLFASTGEMVKVFAYEVGGDKVRDLLDPALGPDTFSELQVVHNADGTVATPKAHSSSCSSADEALMAIAGAMNRRTPDWHVIVRVELANQQAGHFFFVMLAATGKGALRDRSHSPPRTHPVGSPSSATAADQSSPEGSRAEKRRARLHNAQRMSVSHLNECLVAAKYSRRRPIHPRSTALTHLLTNLFTTNSMVVVLAAVSAERCEEGSTVAALRSAAKTISYPSKPQQHHTSPVHPPSLPPASPATTALPSGTRPDAQHSTPQHTTPQHSEQDKDVVRRKLLDACSRVHDIRKNDITTLKTISPPEEVAAAVEAAVLVLGTQPGIGWGGVQRVLCDPNFLKQLKTVADRREILISHGAWKRLKSILRNEEIARKLHQTPDRMASVALTLLEWAAAVVARGLVKASGAKVQSRGIERSDSRLTTDSASPQPKPADKDDIERRAAEVYAELELHGQDTFNAVASLLQQGGMRESINGKIQAAGGEQKIGLQSWVQWITNSADHAAILHHLEEGLRRACPAPAASDPAALPTPVPPPPTVAPVTSAAAPSTPTRPPSTPPTHTPPVGPARPPSEIPPPMATPEKAPAPYPATTDSAASLLEELQHRVAEMEQALAQRDELISELSNSHGAARQGWAATPLSPEPAEAHHFSLSPVRGAHTPREAPQPETWPGEATAPRCEQQPVTPAQAMMLRVEAWQHFCRAAKRDISEKELEKVSHDTLLKLISIYNFDKRPIDAARIELHWSELNGMEVPEPPCPPPPTVSRLPAAVNPREGGVPVSPAKPRTRSSSAPKRRTPSPHAGKRAAHAAPLSTCPQTVPHHKKHIPASPGTSDILSPRSDRPRTPTPSRRPPASSSMLTVGESEKERPVKRREAPVAHSNPNTMAQVKDAFDGTEPPAIEALQRQEIKYVVSGSTAFNVGGKAKGQASQSPRRPASCPRKRPIAEKSAGAAACDPNSLSVSESPASRKGGVLPASGPASCDPNNSMSPRMSQLTPAISKGIGSPSQITPGVAVRAKGSRIPSGDPAACDPNVVGEKATAQQRVASPTGHRKGGSTLPTSPAPATWSFAGMGEEGEERHRMARERERADGDKYFAAAPPDFAPAGGDPSTAGTAKGSEQVSRKGPHTSPTPGLGSDLIPNGGVVCSDSPRGKARWQTPPGSRANGSAHPMFGQDPILTTSYGTIGQGRSRTSTPGENTRSPQVSRKRMVGEKSIDSPRALTVDTPMS